ncbi:hypothetical protein JTE90_000481 [Oedothorax gibbosus]|uniref:Uncharacterized protein n=1 Tax=Oedothorax gibbosus TaxID=931172 RepID=A0AAV6TZU3_9ARAC|nr:hypothetical protein JTE90_000481 [Oedothorax gibbosus]
MERTKEAEILALAMMSKEEREAAQALLDELSKQRPKRRESKKYTSIDPGKYVDIKGNEEADSPAKETRNIEPVPLTITFSDAKAVAKQTLCTKEN